jgi:hypothetical protein
MKDGILVYYVSATPGKITVPKPVSHYRRLILSMIMKLTVNLGLPHALR